VQFTVEKQGGQLIEPLVNPATLQIAGMGEGEEMIGATCTMQDGCVTCSA
jgi:ribonucleoside-diphosphate reductase alpha chain